MASSSSRNCVYDVFPSFSGEDVRVTFLSHLLKEFDRKLIIAFKDNKIERSRSLDPELIYAIKNSRIAVVVFSKNYASSSWCLNELLEIVNCKEEFGQMVIPVFYGLDPSHVRKQTGEFGKIFEETCRHNKTEQVKIQYWREALTDVANILGYHSVTWGNEAEMIEEIVNDVLDKLLLTPSKDSEYFVGIEDHIANMSVLLQLESKEVMMVGLWGSSGIGKTTIARALFNRLSRHFQGSIFIDMAFLSKSLEIYKKANPCDYNMKLHLQRNFLSEIFGKKDIKIDHLGAIENRLKHQKVLVFIDDLDNHVVLEALSGQTQWFGCGSRIIVVTKDKHFLRAHKIDRIYEVCLPSKNQALEMFCRSAFSQNYPPDGFVELASEVSLRAGNLPLGLNVLGSFLRNRDKEGWVDMLPSLRERLNGEVEKTLRVSYDGLNNKKDEALFRHIACFFNGEKVNDIKLLLADSDLNVNIGLKILADKSLIHVIEDTLVMHHLLQEMGKEIVRAQSNEPGEREFLVESKDICNLLEDNNGTKKIIGISLDEDEIDVLHIHKEAFKGMHNLLFLKIYNTNKWYQKKEVRWHLSEGFNFLPPKLRSLRLDGYPMRCMPCNFRPENLVKLQMLGSKLEKLWEGVHSLSGLKIMKLSGSKNLREIPDLTMATYLETLNLFNCSSLVELPSSIQYLHKLIDLEMSFCKNLETLPTGINLQSLDRLNLFRCNRLRTFPDISTNITVLDTTITGMQKISSLHLENLVELNMHGVWMVKLRKREQRLEPLLNTLSPSLKSLWLSDIQSLVELPCSFQNLNQLMKLRITDCINLETLPNGINLESLDYLDLSGCSGLKSFPDISTNILELNLRKTGIEEVPWWIQKFSNLNCLDMTSCNSLKRVSLNISKFKYLKADFSDCGALTEVSWNGSLSELAMATDSIHSKIPDENFSSLPDDSFPEVNLNFLNCFNLDLEALFQQPSVIYRSMILSGEEVPSNFTHRTTIGTSLTNIPLFHTSSSQPFLRFRVCAWCDVKSLSLTGLLVQIWVCCRFIDRLGNHFDAWNWNVHCTSMMLGSHLLIFDCFFVLPHLYFDHVDVQFHTREDDSMFEIKGWGIQVLSKDCTAFSDTQTGNPNVVARVCEADESNRDTETENDQACRDSGVKSERSRRRIKITKHWSCSCFKSKRKFCFL